MFRRFKNILSATLACVALVNICNVGTIQGGIYSAEEKTMKFIAPVADNFIDTEFVTDKLIGGTKTIFSIPVVEETLNTWNASGAASTLTKMFSPLMGKYDEIDIASVLKNSGLRFDVEDGKYVITGNLNSTSNQLDNYFANGGADEEDLQSGE